MSKFVLFMALMLAACDTATTGGVPTEPPVTPSFVTPPTTSSSTPTITPPITNPTATVTVTATVAARSTPTIVPTTSPIPVVSAPIFSYPIAWPKREPGDGFVVRHGFQTENTWYNPGYWHTGEDWYALDENETAGARVLAIADGEVVYAGANYPGRVVIIRHGEDLYSMYGHLNPVLAIEVNEQVARGHLLGTVLHRNDDVPNHLHFEVRTFVTTPVVNGASPRYGFRCGRECPPGPGYWPINAPDLPSALGYLNPTHVINGRAFAATPGQIGEVVVVARPVSATIQLWSAPPGAEASAQPRGEAPLVPGERFALLDIAPGPDTPNTTSALSYRLWYRIVLPDKRDGWVQAAVATTIDTGGDGRSSSIAFNLVPVVSAVSASAQVNMRE